MKIHARNRPGLDASSLVGIAVGMGLLIPACFVPEMTALVIPAFVVLLWSLLCGTR